VLFCPDAPWNERLVHRNLACMWPNARRAGADRPILGRVLEDRSLLRYVAEAVVGTQITVIRLTAGLGQLGAGPGEHFVLNKRAMWPPRPGPCDTDAGRTPLAGCGRRPAPWLHGGARGRTRTASGR
jgi:hypothetical protein